jgi:Zn-dependent protease with chaperone function
MIVLPLVYVAIALASVFGVVWLATGGRDLFFLLVRPGYLSVMGYGAVVIASVLLAAFLFKPLFARTPRSVKSVQVEPSREPVLFKLVECITEAVGAPMPDEILADTEVNASARLTRGLLSKELTLTIGLPLFWGCDAKTLTGVLAHEFGHFTQQWGMRAAWTVDWINHWFYRQVHERDTWDRFVDELLARDVLLLNLAAGLARLGSGLCRLLLVGLSHVAGLISYSFSRQMEFDADRYEIALVGSEQYERTVASLRILGAAQGAALTDLGKALEAGKKIDNLPLLVARRAERFSAQDRKRIVAAIEEVNTNAFDTHPADQERIDAARSMQAKSTFELDGSAARFLREADRLSRVATLQWYRAMGLDVQPGDLAPLQSFEEETGNLERAKQASLQFFAGLDDLPLWFDCPAGDAFEGMSDEQLAGELAAMQGDLRLKRKEYAGRRDRLKLHRGYLADYGHARFWRERGVETDPSSYRLKVSMATLEEIDANLAEHRDVVAGLEQELAGCAATLGRQLGVGLEVARRAGRASRAELRQLNEAYECLGQSANKARLLGATCDNLRLLIELCERFPGEAKHQRQLDAEAERSTLIAEAIRNVLGRMEAFAFVKPAGPAPDVETVMSGTAAAQQAHAEARQLLAQIDRLVLGTRGRMAELASVS